MTLLEFQVKIQQLQAMYGDRRIAYIDGDFSSILIGIWVESEVKEIRLTFK